MAQKSKNDDLLYLNFYNSAPRYITFPQLFSHSFKDATLAKDLIAHLESNSANSCLDITEDNVVECNLYETKNTKILTRVEEHLDKILKVINTFLHYNSPIQSVDSWNDVVWIRKYTPSIDEELMNLDNYTVNITNDETQSFRTLGPFMHYDYNSNYYLEENNKNYSTPDLASLVVTLNNADEYEGGEIVVSDGFHSQSGIAQLKTLEKSNAGEGVLWDGWTLHGVNPVTSGVRYIMVVHFQGKMR